MKKLLNKILWEGKSRWQLFGAGIGVFLGLFLLLSAVQFYVDVSNLMSGEGAKNDQFVQINKKINFLNMLGVKPSFSAEEIQKIDSLEVVQSVGSFTPSQFKVSATMPSLGFRTDMFFESVPDNFLDVETQRFRWSKGQKEIPVVISRDYLALYNFGFAPSQGLPALTPSTIEKFSVTIQISGNGLRDNFKGRIVGLSDRINSILVPQSFNDWANDIFGSSQNYQSSRLILKVDNPMSKELKKFMEANSYEISQGKLIGGQFGILLNILVGVVGIIGFIIVILAVLVFVLNFQLIISQSKEDIKLLLQLGYKSKEIGNILLKKIALIFGGIFLTVLVTLIILRSLMIDFFSEQGFDLGKSLDWQVYVAAFSFVLIFSFLNFKNIRSNIEKLFQ